MSCCEFRYPSGSRGRCPGSVAAGVVALVVGFLLLPVLGPGCAHFTVDDRELDRAISGAQLDLEAGDPEAAIRRLRSVTRRRGESVLAREMLVEACLRRDTIESRADAEELLRELLELEPDRPRHRYALAALLLKQGFERYAYQELTKLRSLAPGHAGAYLALAGYHRAQWQRYSEVRDLQAMVASYQRAASLEPENREARRHWAMSLMLLDQFDEARQLLEELLAGEPADSPDPHRAWLGALHATCRVEVGEYAEAAAEFETAFDQMTAAERTPFFDLSLVTDPYAVNRLLDLPPGEAADFRRTYWKPLDPTPTTRVNERQIEHYRRVTMADVLYANPRRERRGFDTARGEMLIRYGEPRVLEFRHGHVAEQLVPPHWVHTYKAGDELFTVTFMDYTLDGTFYHAITSYPTFADVAAYTMPQGYAHHYAGRWLDHAMGLVAFQGSGTATREELYLAVPVDSLTQFDGDALQVEAVVFDAQWEERARVEEAIRLDRAPVVGASRVLVHQLDLPLEPGEYRVATMVYGETSGGGHAGAVISSVTRELTVEPFPPTTLALSELELAYGVESLNSGPFDKGAVAVIPNASGVYAAAELLYFYFEIYGLELDGARALYELTYRIRPVEHTGRGFFGRLGNLFRDRSFIEARVTEESPTAMVQRHLAVDLGALEAGRFRLALRVRDLSNGATTKREVVFERLAAADAVR